MGERGGAGGENRGKETLKERKAELRWWPGGQFTAVESLAPS